MAECAYVDGVLDDTYNTCAVRIDQMTAGKYFIFYTAKFNKDQLYRKLNVIMYGSDNYEMKRISARMFSDSNSSFFEDLEYRNFRRLEKGANYN